MRKSWKNWINVNNLKSRVKSFEEGPGVVKGSFSKTNVLLEISKKVEGPLKGYLYSLKELIFFPGVVTGGSKTLSNFKPPYNSTVFELLSKSGGIHLAPSICDEFGLSGTGLDACSGPLKNPFDPKRIVGGSSSGSCLMVQRGDVDFAIATDTGDSSRRPASFVGVVGFKPSYGAISRWGILPYCSGLDTVSVISQEIEVCREVLKVLNSEQDPKDMTMIQLRDKMFEGPITLGYYPWDTRIVGMLGELTDRGYKLVSVQPDFSWDLRLLYKVIAYSESIGNYMTIGSSHCYGHDKGEGREFKPLEVRKGFGDEFVYRQMLGMNFLQDGAYEKARGLLPKLVGEIEKMFSNVQVVISTTSEKAPLIEEADNILKGDKFSEAVLISNFGGLPAISIPWLMEDGMPVGLHLTSAGGTDFALLKFVASFSQELKK